jgi:protease I
MAGKKILMLVGEFSEEYEIFVFEQAMHAVGHTVHVVCPDKKAGDVLKTSLHDFEGHQTYTEKLGHDYILNKTFSEVRLEDYDAVYCAGGRGPEYIRIDKRVQAMVRHFHDTGKPIYIDVAPNGAHVDGNLVSAKGWPGLAAFMRECLKVLGTEVKHGEILMRESSLAA